MQFEHLEFGLCLYSMLLSEHKILLYTMNKRAVRNIVEKHKIDTPFICTPIQCWHNYYYGSIVAGLNLFLHKHAVSFLCPIFSPCCNILLASGCHEFEMPC